MGGWASWLLPIAAVLLIGLSATLYIRRVRLPREESTAGVAALAGMRWRDFIHLVLDALIARGYERVFETQSEAEEGDYILERDGQRFLLSSKHGAAYVLGSTAIAEFASNIRMRGAAGGLLVTPGQFAPEARPLARAQRIELLDGPTLWPELQPLLPQVQRSTVSAPLQTMARRHILLAWGFAAVNGILLFAVMHRDAPVAGRAAMPASVTAASDASSVTVAPTRPPSASPITPSQPPPPAPAVIKPVSAPVAPVSGRDPENADQVNRRRTEIADAISTLPGIQRAAWESQSTLLVHLTDDASDPMPVICPLLQRHEAFAAARLHLQPPAGSSRPVRFVQCQPY